MVQASVGFQCPACVHASPSKTLRPSDLRRPPLVTQVLIGINVAMFLLTALSSSNPTRALQTLGGGDGPIADLLLLIGAPFTDGQRVYGGVSGGEWWRLLSGGFLHGGVLHLGMNMFALWVIGSQLEQVLGRARYLGIYFVSLFAGSLGVMLLDPAVPTVGASGAIYGLMGVAFILVLRSGQPVMSSGISQVIAINLFFTFAFGGLGISIGGHVGGLLGGALAMQVMAMAERKKPDPRIAVANSVGLRSTPAGRPSTTGSAAAPSRSAGCCRAGPCGGGTRLRRSPRPGGGPAWPGRASTG